MCAYCLDGLAGRSPSGEIPHVDLGVECIAAESVETQMATRYLGSSRHDLDTRPLQAIESIEFIEGSNPSLSAKFQLKQ